MHGSVQTFATDWFGGGRVWERVLEVGSLDVNGSLRDRITSKEWVGIDLRPGPGVDVVMDAVDLPGDLGAFDLVLCTEVLEHAYHWHAVLQGCARALNDRGILFVTARGPGYRHHPHPEDHWRFTPELFRRSLIRPALLWCAPDPDPLRPGVFVVWSRGLQALPAPRE